MNPADPAKAWRQILAETRWADLSHAYGRADDTPGHLLALLADDPQTRGAAGAHLTSAVIHQATPWPVTYPATTVVLGMLDDPAVAPSIDRSRPFITEYLAEVGECLDRMSKADWLKLEQWAADADGHPRAATLDWATIDDDAALANGLYSRAMLQLRTLRPAISAHIEGVA